MKPFLILLFTTILIPFCLGAQNTLPPIHNYKNYEYEAASKNWGLSVSVDGELYVANNSGLLHFNGEKWKLFKLPNKTTIRSVANINGKIYTGSYEEFGYWTKNKVGLLEYTSLTHLIKNHEFTSEEFWQIISFQDAIIFRSFSVIYILRDNEIKVVNAPFIVSYIASYEKQLLIACDRNRLYTLVNEELQPLEEHNLLADKIITDLDSIENGLLIGTKLNGCYLLKNGELTAFDSEINAELKRYQLNQILPLSDGTIAFGTIKNGIYIYDVASKHYKEINRKVGLQNNTVLSMIQFKNQLWIGLDNGIDRIQLNNPLNYFTDYSGTVGTVYDLAVHDNVLYIGSNTGIYYFEDDLLKFVEGSQGHVWDLNITNGDLLCGHNTGTFKINKGILEKVSDISGGYQIVKVPESNNIYIQGTYNGLAKYVKGLNDNWAVTPIPGLSSPVKYLCFEDPNTIWVAHPYKGLHRLIINDDYNEIIESQEFNTESMPNNYNVKVYNIKNQIALYIEGIWYRFDPILKKIAPFKELQSYNHKNLIFYENGFFWFIDNEGSKEVLYTNLNESSYIINDLELKERLAPEAENIIKFNDSKYLFTLNDGFGQLDLSKFQTELENFEFSKPKLVSFKDEEKLYELSEPLVIPYKLSQNLVFNFAAPSLTQPKYQYELKGNIDLSSTLEDGEVNFQNLPYGKYELNISTIRLDNERSDVTKIVFQIAPPWYLSKLSLALYIFSIFGIIWIVRWYNKRKLNRKQDKLRLQLQKEQKEHIAQLEKEKLEKEVKLKQKELTSTTLNVAKKNQLILELKNLLLMNKDKFSNQQRYRAFMKKLNSSMNDDADWKHFELNFKELHNDFFEILLSRFPKLTPKDLKLCAYLKMNLSSKEIAPLMGITTRGVEIHRYRLRKKLEIDGSTNISNYLITLR